MSASSASLTLLLPGLLTDAAIAPELARQLEGLPGARTLLSWLGAATPREEVFVPFEAGCTAREYWWLRRAGHVPAEGGKPGSALAPLLAGNQQDDAPVWLAELAHIQVGRHGPVLADTATLAASEQESAELLAAARPILDEHGIVVADVQPGRWQLRLPVGMGLHTGTPDAVAGAALDFWWPRTEASRPWRKLLNEIQMSWHEHPVNLARERRGQAPVNALWLHGGALPWAPSWPGGRPASIGGPEAWLHALAVRSGLSWLDTGAMESGQAVPAPARSSGPAADPATLAGAVLELPHLAEPERADDWRAWLDALPRLEQEWLAALGQALASGRLPSLTLVLPGRERLVTLHIEPRPRLLRWLPQTRHDWKRWWLPRES
ncbi:hypothetical protein PIGHUM_04370 [Pigmentiphaga humi]|uniref:Cofactor-independent phosphoglycerate mutase n=1 Tax=Pigmentiphaga humi TaxID=2478468 RepID=A0A3P4B8K2_9BURK|nr:hypothetical protein [Pigmentiphaga humi]VCU72271.1 hypothetical protein PIGHUM_04370 [Pigmentiphaga humi]